MGAENSREQREREQAVRDEAKRNMERQKLLYEQQCKSLELALKKQQNAYLELKKKEEIQKEVQRLLKERQQEEDKKVTNQQTPPIKLAPSAPPADSYSSPNHPLPSIQSQNLVQQACPTFQFSNLQVNPHKQPHMNFQPQPLISNVQPTFQPQLPTQQYMPAAPKPLLPTPQAGPSTFHPQISQAVPLSFLSQISNPQPGTSKPQFQYKSQMSANQNRTLSPSPTNGRSSNLHSQNIGRRDTSPHKTRQPHTSRWNSRESSNDRRNRNSYVDVKNEVKTAIKSLENPKLYPNLQKGNPFDKKRTAAIVNNNLPNFNSENTNSYVNNNVQAQGISNTPTARGRKRSSSRPRRRPKKNEEDDNDVKCCTCDNRLGLYIYQCMEGHSSCKDCKLKGFRCGQCSSLIKDLRNFPLEAYVAEFVRPCPNASEGCNREHKLKEMDEHLKSCPFNEVLCPLSDYYQECYWKGKISEIRIHFTDKHPEHFKAGMGKEFTIKDISIETHSINLITIGPYNFLVHSKITDQQIYFAVQLLSTQSNALKWTYQFDLYNKSRPCQKYEYKDTCHSANINIERIFGNSKCATIPIGYAETFRNKEGTFNYKFFITKGPNKKGFENWRGKNTLKGNTNDK